MKIQEPNPEDRGEKKGKQKGIQMIHELYEKLKDDLQDLKAIAQRKNEKAVPLEKVIKLLKKNDR